MLLRSKNKCRQVFLLLLAGVCLLSLNSVSLAQEYTGEDAVSLDPAVREQLQARKAPQAEAVPAQGPSVSLHLGGRHFDPLSSAQAPAGPLSGLAAYDESRTSYYIVQFDGPVQKAWKEALKNAGAEIFDYVPDFAFMVRLQPEKLQAVAGLAHVRWVGPYRPAYRVSQAAVDKTYTATGKEGDVPAPCPLRVIVFPGADLAAVREAIGALGGSITSESATKRKTTLAVTIGADAIAGLAAVEGVKWIEPAYERKLFNNVSTDIMEVRTPRDTEGLYGQGQTVAVCDTGLDQGSTSPASLHDDFEDGSGSSRVVEIFDRVGDGASDVNSGHGTHVAGSVLGNGARSGSTPASDTYPSSAAAGMAPGAALIFQAVEDNSAGTLSGLPDDLNDLFSQADDAGADLHTNSWGSSLKSQYTIDSQSVDEYLWDNKDFFVLFSAGNDGVDLDGDGVIDLYSMGAPATAKNCLTVGASESERTGVGYDIWGTGSWLNKYSAEPITSDSVSDDAGGMAAFSSRGPVLDGRYKPDIVAPGTNILSARSSLATGTGWGAYDTYYMWMGGTSMSCPLAAGAAALFREYLTTETGMTAPSGSLVKAAIINSAQDIYPGQYGTGSYLEIPAAPGNVQGWGRLNLAAGVYPAAPAGIRYFDETTGLETGESKTHRVQITDATQPLKVSLVWTDYPGTPAAQGGLVNDLDLLVDDPSDSSIYPDGAVKKSAVETLIYDADAPQEYYTDNKRAMRFTPSAYPAHVESATLFFYNMTNSSTDVAVVVYDDDGAGSLPGTELYRKTLTYLPTGYHTIGIGGVTVSSGDFYIAVEKSDSNQAIIVDKDGNPTDRGYFYSDSQSQWLLSGATAYIRANVRGAAYTTEYDRVNNVVGVRVAAPTAGVYDITISGYNVPQGPQPYSLVVSGGIGCTDSSQCDDGVDCTTDTCQNGVCVGIPDDSACSDGNACTDDTCDAGAGCVYTNDDTNTCSDGIDCTTDACQSGSCVGTPDDSACDDGNACTDDTCDTAAGCVNTNDDTNTCSDDVDCTTDACQSGSCVGTPDDSACDNGLFCDGQETCDATLGCQNAQNPCATGTECDEEDDVCRDVQNVEPRVLPRGVLIPRLFEKKYKWLALYTRDSHNYTPDLSTIEFTGPGDNSTGVSLHPTRQPVQFWRFLFLPLVIEKDAAKGDWTVTIRTLLDAAEPAVEYIQSMFTLR